MRDFDFYTKVGKVLQGARDIVASRWCKGSYVSKGGEKIEPTPHAKFGIPDDDFDDFSYCGDGALRRAVKNLIKNSRYQISNTKARNLLETAQFTVSRAISRKNYAFRDEGEGGAPAIWGFNDAPETKKEDVLEVIDRAIAENCEVVKQKAAEEGHDAGRN